MARLRSVSRGRLAVAALVFIAALAGASVLYGHRERVALDGPVYCFGPSATPRCTEHVVRAWVAPTSLTVLLLGAAGAVGVLVLSRRTSN